MLLYRVFPYRAASNEGEAGHPLYLHTPQGAGRLDNPDHYLVRYFAYSVEGAVAETFGGLTRWTSAMFAFPGLAGGERALGAYTLPDETPILDLDDAHALVERGLRPTQIVSRDRTLTQAWALRISQEPAGWAGVKWWSSYRPHWSILGLWNDAGLEVLAVTPLAIDHPGVIEAAAELAKLRGD